MGRDAAGLHPYPYSSKFAAFDGECAQQVRRALTQERGRGTAGRRERQFRGAGVGYCDARRQRSRQRVSNALLQRNFALTALQQLGHCRLADDDLMQAAHGHRSSQVASRNARAGSRGEVI